MSKEELYFIVYVTFIESAIILKKIVKVAWYKNLGKKC